MKPILLYLILVGLPVLAIFGLLRAGQKLSAPISLAGAWNAQLNLENPPDSSVRTALIHPGPTVLSITQSGPHVFLTFDELQTTTLIGNVQDLTVYASFIPESGGPTNTSGSKMTAIYFHGRVDRQTQPDRLLGVITFDRGPVRSKVSVIASRQSGVRQPTGGH
jgi:hypothetical protein